MTPPSRQDARHRHGHQEQMKGSRKIGEIGEIGGFGEGSFFREGAKSDNQIELQLFYYQHLTTYM